MSLSNPSSAAPLILISAVLLLSIPTTSAVNITSLLEQLPEFSEFNNLLTKTQVANEINRRRTITVLALSNEHVGEIAGKPEDVQKRILSNHVVLDYYDTTKLTELEVNKTCVLTTLFQASGVANQQQGFLHVIHNKDDSVVFGSAVQGSPLDSKLEESVASQPYDISVLSISHAIIAPGIDGALRPVSSPPPAPTANQVPPPAESPKEKKPADAPAAVKVPPPAETPKKPADAPAAVEVPPPAASPKKPAVTPSADSPAAVAADAPANAPTPGAQPADADQSPANTAGKQLTTGVSLGLIVAFASAFPAVL